MENQTENYIILKPIAERFNRIAKEISDDEIKSIIKNEMREQIKGRIDFSKLDDITDTYIDDNEYEIKKMIADTITNKLMFR
jgi:hypothetical protein